MNLPTQRGEAGAPLLNFKGEVVGILVSSVDSRLRLLCPARLMLRKKFGAIMCASAIRATVGSASTSREATKSLEGSSAEMTQIRENTPAAGSGLQTGDILLQVGNVPVHQPEDVIDASFFISARRRGPDYREAGRSKADVHGAGCLSPSREQWHSVRVIKPRFPFVSTRLPARRRSNSFRRRQRIPQGQTQSYAFHAGWLCFPSNV